MASKPPARKGFKLVPTCQGQGKGEEQSSPAPAPALGTKSQPPVYPATYKIGDISYNKPGFINLDARISPAMPVAAVQEVVLGGAGNPVLRLQIYVTCSIWGLKDAMDNGATMADVEQAIRLVAEHLEVI